MRRTREPRKENKADKYQLDSRWRADECKKEQRRTERQSIGPSSRKKTEEKVKKNIC